MQLRCLRIYYQAMSLAEVQAVNPLGFAHRKSELEIILRLLATVETTLRSTGRPNVFLHGIAC